MSLTATRRYILYSSTYSRPDFSLRVDPESVTCRVNSQTNITRVRGLTACTRLGQLPHQPGTSSHIQHHHLTQDPYNFPLPNPPGPGFDIDHHQTENKPRTTPDPSTKLHGRASEPKKHHTAVVRISQPPSCSNHHPPWPPCTPCNARPPRNASVASQPSLPFRPRRRVRRPPRMKQGLCFLASRCRICLHRQGASEGTGPDRRGSRIIFRS